MTEEKNKLGYPKTIEQLEALSNVLADVGYPTDIIQKIRSTALYHFLCQELRNRLGGLETRDMYGENPITYTSDVGYRFLVSQ